MKEIEVQTEIKQSVRADGGYCHKLTNAYTVGIPDLLIALPPFAPCVIEVKDLKEVTQGFDRVLGVTPKQKHELVQITEVYKDRPNVPWFSGIFVHAVWDGEHYITGLPYYADRHTHGRLLDDRVTRKRELRGSSGKRWRYWDVRGLLEASGVTKL